MIVLTTKLVVEKWPTKTLISMFSVLSHNGDEDLVSSGIDLPSRCWVTVRENSSSYTTLKYIDEKRPSRTIFPCFQSLHTRTLSILSAQGSNHRQAVEKMLGLPIQLYGFEACPLHVNSGVILPSRHCKWEFNTSNMIFWKTVAWFSMVLRHVSTS
jgi:hypothetical protein